MIRLSRDFFYRDFLCRDFGFSRFLSRAKCPRDFGFEQKSHIRNRLLPETVRTELFNKLNFPFTCDQFYHFV